jgi:hypothetical protein
LLELGERHRREHVVAAVDTTLLLAFTDILLILTIESELRLTSKLSVESNVQIIDKRGVDEALAGDRKAAQEGRSHVQVHHPLGGTDGIALTLALIHVHIHLHILGIEFKAWDGAMTYKYQSRTRTLPRSLSW